MLGIQHLASSIIVEDVVQLHGYDDLMEAALQSVMLLILFVCYVGKLRTSTWAGILRFGGPSLLGIQHLASSVIIEHIVQLT